MTLDIKIFHLNTSLNRYKYICLKMIDLLEDVIKEYKLRNKVTNYGYIYVEVQKGMFILIVQG